MPIYEYQCADCGFRSEELQKMGARPLKKCPECGGKYQKLLSAPAFQFKGSGWYVTDYAKKSGGGGKEGDSSSSESTKDKAKSGDKAKPEKSKSETKPKTSSKKDS